MLNRLTNQTRKQKGDEGEALACQYLQEQGLELVTTNFTSKFGEIDLIMNDAQRGNLVFIEVRYRKNNQYGGAAISVTPKKQRRIIKTALYYMQRHAPHTAARFDVVAIEGNINNSIQGKNTINWIIDAFQ